MTWCSESDSSLLLWCKSPVKGWTELCGFELLFKSWCRRERISHPMPGGSTEQKWSMQVLLDRQLLPRAP